MALLSVLAIVLSSGTAHAAPSRVKFTWPPGQEQVNAHKPIQAYVWFGPTGSIGTRDATLTLKSLDDPSRPEVVVAAEQVAEGACVPVTFDIPRLLYNGQYQATITSEVPLGTVGTPSEECAGASETSPVSFAVPPVAPANVVGTVKQRLVELRWDTNPEGDVVRYRVMRAKGNGSFERVGDAGATSITVPADEGGEQRFQVIALRRGATRAAPLLESPPSAVFSLTVPPPPPPVVVPGARTGGVRRPSVVAPRPRPVSPPDTGFRQTLPFAEGPAQLEEGEQAAVPPAEDFREIGADEERADDKRNLAVLAAGLLVTVLVMHLLWVKGEVDREPLEAIGPE